MDIWVDWLARLQSRLPELERQLAKIAYFPKHGLPKGLFQDAETFEACIATIRRDIEIIRRAPEATVVDYLVKNIHQKIAVLVHIGRAQGTKLTSSSPQQSLLTTLSTREQWLSQISATQSKLLAQQSALLDRLETLDVHKDTAICLAIRAELGVIARELAGLRENNLRFYQD